MIPLLAVIYVIFMLVVAFAGSIFGVCCVWKTDHPGFVALFIFNAVVALGMLTGFIFLVQWCGIS